MTHDEEYLQRVSKAQSSIPLELIELLEAYGSCAIDWGYESGQGITNQYATDPYANIRRAQEAYHEARIALLEGLAK